MVRLLALSFGPDQPVISATPAGRTANPADTEEEELRVLAAKAPGDDALKRPLMVEDASRDVIIAEAPGTATAVLVFTAANDRVTFPLQILDRFLAAHGVTAIYIKDFQRLRFLNGVRSLGDNYERSIAAIREMVARLGARRICTIGNCEGGFASIRYGVDLGADRIIACKAPTYVTPDCARAT